MLGAVEAGKPGRMLFGELVRRGHPGSWLRDRAGFLASPSFGGLIGKIAEAMELVLGVK